MTDEPGDDLPSLSDSFLARLVAVGAGLHRPTNKCPACGSSRWETGDETLLMTTVTTAGNLTVTEPGTTEGWEAFPVWCGNCGFLRLHAIQPLMRD